MCFVNRRFLSQLNVLGETVSVKLAPPILLLPKGGWLVILKSKRNTVLRTHDRHVIDPDRPEKGVWGCRVLGLGRILEKRLGARGAGAGYGA